MIMDLMSSSNDLYLSNDLNACHVAVEKKQDGGRSFMSCEQCLIMTPFSVSCSGKT